MSSHCDTDNYPEFFDEKWVAKPRKPHRCCECGSTINGGHVYLWGKWVDSGFADFRQCADCYHLCRAIHQMYGECIIAFGCLADWAFDCDWFGYEAHKQFYPLLVEKFPKLKDTMLEMEMAYDATPIDEARALMLEKSFAYARCSAPKESPNGQ